MCFQKETSMSRKNMFKFSIGMLVDRKMEIKSTADLSLLLKED
jgi:hypothetical protein